MAKRFSLLWVDADVSSLAGIEPLLRAEFDVSSATTAEAGLLQVHQKSFDVVCSDGHIADTRGLDFLRTVAQEDPRSELILFTSTKSLFLSSPTVPSESICYVFKPYHPDSLLETMRSLAATAASKPPR